MSRKVGKAFLIVREPEAVCAFCCHIAELRPYGPKGERICFDCANKDPVTTAIQVIKAMEGTDFAVVAVAKPPNTPPDEGHSRN